jgi:hypothetical protein
LGLPIESFRVFGLEGSMMMLSGGVLVAFWSWCV